MAIDSAKRRRSAGGVGFFIYGPGITPDSAKDAAWRQASAWSYTGILAGAAPIVIGTQITTANKRLSGSGGRVGISGSGGRVGLTGRGGRQGISGRSNR